MAKDNNKKYKLDMGISLEGMSDVPEDKTVADIFVGYVFAVLIPVWLKGKGGGSYQESKDIYVLKELFQTALKTKDTTVVLEKSQLKFLNKAVKEVTQIPPEGLEMIRRCGLQIENAFQNELT